MKKISTILSLLALTVLSLRAQVLFQDSTNYPYVNGCIEGQGQWYCYSPVNTTNLDALVTNDVLILNETNKDSVATPTNGWDNSSGTFTFASFAINVSQLPSTANGGYFVEFQNHTASNNVCHIFIDTLGTVVPGTYRLGIANVGTTFNSTVPPTNFPVDLAPGITYNVVFGYDTDQNDTTAAGVLFINPSAQDYANYISDADNDSDTYEGQSYVYPTDVTTDPNVLDIQIAQIGFSPYANAGISNVIAAADFADVNTTYPPTIGIQPQSGTNYAGNSTTFYTAASGVDLAYQWYSSEGALVDDDVNIFGSQSNILTLNNLSASDTYYVIVTDAYANTATSATATNTVITTPTAPFFPPALPGQASAGGLNVTNYLFTGLELTNAAEGTGPLYYQWYFAPTNIPVTFTSLGGQTSSTLTIAELEYPNAGSYYVVASNADGLTAGPTNTLHVTAPLVATLPQLHDLMQAEITNITGANEIVVSSNYVTVTGYVTTFSPLTTGTKKYSEFYIQYQNSGIYVYYDHRSTTLTNSVPPPGSFVSVSGPCEVYSGQLEIDPTNPVADVTISNTIPVQMPAVQLGNFQVLATNALGTNGVIQQCSLVTFTNIYIYGSKLGVAIGNGGKFYTNSNTSLYMFQGPFSRPNNTNYIELYCTAYSTSPYATNLWGQLVSTNAYQVSGVLENFDGSSEVGLTRFQDIVATAPSITTSLSVTGGVATVGWLPQTGSTYSVYSATNVAGPWANLAFGLSYYPTNGTYVDTNRASTKFYKVGTP